MTIDWDKHVLGPCEAVFGEDLDSITYSPAGGQAFDTTGIFIESYREVNGIADAVPMNSELSVLDMRLARFPAGRFPAQGDQVTVHRVASTYVVRDVRPDGHGSAKLLLNFVSAA